MEKLESDTPDDDPAYTPEVVEELYAISEQASLGSVFRSFPSISCTES